MLDKDFALNIKAYKSNILFISIMNLQAVIHYSFYTFFLIITIERCVETIKEYLSEPTGINIYRAAASDEDYPQ